MHSNFITPPDFVETVLIVDATQDQIQALGAILKGHERPYNVYLYSSDMNELDWLTEAVNRANTVLQAEGSTVPLLSKKLFGPNQILKTPAHYFTK